MGEKLIRWQKVFLGDVDGLEDDFDAFQTGAYYILYSYGFHNLWKRLFKLKENVSNK